MRRLVFASLALLGLAAPCLAQSSSQGPPDFGIDTSGTYRNLSVRDAVLGARVPFGILDTADHSFVVPTIPIEQFGAKGDSSCVSGGGTDDTAAFQASQALGVPISLRPGSSYRVTSRVTLSDGGGFVGPATACVYADPATFNNANTATRYGTNGVVFYAVGSNSGPSYTPLGKITLSGFRLVGGKGDATTDGRVISAISLGNVAEVHISDMDISGFPLGVGIRLASIGRGWIEGNYIHDFYDDTTAWTGKKQITGIETDDDRFGSPTYGSTYLKIRGNRIDNLVVGPNFIAAFDYQTDGINLGSESYFNEVSGNTISRVGEAVDTFGFDSVISNNIFENIYGVAVKLPHGASRNLITGNVMSNLGLGGVYLAPGETRDTDRNVIVGNQISNIDPTNLHSGSARYCIRTDDNIPGFHVANTKVIGNVCSPAPNGNYAIDRQGDGTGNDYVGNFLETGSAGITRNVNGETGLFSTAGSPGVAVANAWAARNTYTVTSAGAATIPLALNNASNSANTEVCLDLAPNTTGVGVRTAQVCSQNVGGAANEANLVFRVAAGSTPVARLTISKDGIATFLAVQITPRLVSALPTCVAGLEGLFGTVTDANSTTYNAAAAGGGANHMPVYCNGSGWVLH